jgi:hypothetical protein
MSVVYNNLEGRLRLGHLETSVNEENVSLKTFLQGDDGAALHLLYLCSFGQQKRPVFDNARRQRIAFKPSMLHGDPSPPKKPAYPPFPRTGDLGTLRKLTQIVGDFIGDSGT